MAEKRILVRAGKHPYTAMSAEDSALRSGRNVFGGNVGNQMFSEAVVKSVTTPHGTVAVDGYGAERATDLKAYAQEVNETYDHYVFPLANAFRPQYISRLDSLSTVLEELTIPATVVGVGGQFNLDGDHTGISTANADSSRRFVRAVLERSATIGVRGEVTHDFLVSLGFPSTSIDIIGCPSLTASSHPVPVVKKHELLSPQAKVAITLSPQIPGLVRFLNQQLDDYPELDYIPQTVRDLRLMLWGQPYRPGLDHRLPINDRHKLMQTDQMRFFLDRSTWTRALQDYDFVVGTRIHGTIAGLLAGTPSVLIAHDSRTRELAEYHAIPYRSYVRGPNQPRAAELYAEADFEEFNRRRAEHHVRYKDFLRRNHLDTIFDYDNAETEWDEKLASVDFPPAALSYLSPGAAAARSPLQALRFNISQSAKKLRKLRRRLKRKLKSSLKRKAARGNRARK